jgi:tetrahydromethanopterin S-methyltransferase subunit D
MVGMKVLQIFDLLKLQCTYSTKITIAILLCIFNISVANAAYQRGYLNLGFETPSFPREPMSVVFILVAHVYLVG